MVGVGWIMTVVIGALAGWIAEQIMQARHGLVVNIALGILGAVVLNAILRFVVGWTLGGWIGQLIVAVAGACLLIYGYRMLNARR